LKTREILVTDLLRGNDLAGEPVFTDAPADHHTCGSRGVFANTIFGFDDCVDELTVLGLVLLEIQIVSVLSVFCAHWNVFLFL
jgi:hypothetical protein